MHMLIFHPQSRQPFKDWMCSKGINIGNLVNKKLWAQHVKIQLNLEIGRQLHIKINKLKVTLQLKLYEVAISVLCLDNK